MAFHGDGPWRVPYPTALRGSDYPMGDNPWMFCYFQQLLQVQWMQQLLVYLIAQRPGSQEPFGFQHHCCQWCGCWNFVSGSPEAGRDRSKPSGSGSGCAEAGWGRSEPSEMAEEPGVHGKVNVAEISGVEATGDVGLFRGDSEQLRESVAVLIRDVKDHEYDLMGSELGAEPRVSRDELRDRAVSEAGGEHEACDQLDQYVSDQEEEDSVASGIAAAAASSAEQPQLVNPNQSLAVVRDRDRGEAAAVCPGGEDQSSGKVGCAKVMQKGGNRSKEEARQQVENVLRLLREREASRVDGARRQQGRQWREEQWRGNYWW